MGVNAQLLEHPVFSGADADAISAALSGIEPRSVEQGTLLYTPGADPPRLFLVLEGRLRTFQLTPDGRRVLFGLVEAGDIDGVLTLHGHLGHFSEAERRSTIATLSRAELDAVIRADPVVAYNLVWLVTARLGRREEQVSALATRNPTQRIARQLLEIASTSGENENGKVVIRRRLTHQMLADMVGLRRETVTIHLRQLARTGAVTRSGRNLVLQPALIGAIVEGNRARAKG
jgi:CRP-like cAMP-binding protein